MSSEQSPRSPVLVVCDAGDAGRDLLSRRDLDLAWALTADEAEAALKAAHPELVLVREPLAAEVLAYARDLKRPVPVVVLLEKDGWANRQGYQAAGAAALVQASARPRILEAVGTLTGRTFPDHVRVPFTEFVEVQTESGSKLVETVDLSYTGMGLRYLPEAAMGQYVTVCFDGLNPPITVAGVVIRVANDIVGVHFHEESAEMMRRLHRLVDAQNARFPLPEMPEGFTVDLNGTFTMELLAQGSFGEDNDPKFRRLLKDAVVEGNPSRQGWPRWLTNIETRLTALERRCFKQDPIECHASASIDLRIMLARLRLESPDTFPTRSLAQRVLDFSRMLEEHSDGESVADLADVATIRAHLLRAVYGDMAKQREPTAA
ncbi:MAG: PilZ domain-containing protein [Myxococcales bacterium]|nr:PilZ domain-containing protein [Myxococcales bacterium]MCB9651009.1 PilZ domain-containing protein [Deltaproteobacteria bacterium]